jgi:hypothetical protein
MGVQKQCESALSEETEENKNGAGETQSSFNRELYQTYLLNKCTDWTNGKLSNIRVVPRLIVLGHTSSSSSSSRVSRLSKLYIKSISKSLYPTKENTPFIDSDANQIDVPAHQDMVLGPQVSSYAAEKIPKLEKLSDIYKLNGLSEELQGKIAPRKQIFRADAPERDNKRDNSIERIYACDYRIVADLECDELLKSQPIVIDTVSSIEQLESKEYDDLFNQEKPVFIEFKESTRTGDVKIRQKSSNKVTVLTDYQSRFLQNVFLPVTGFLTGISLVFGDNSIFNSLNPFEFMSFGSTLFLSVFLCLLYGKYSESGSLFSSVSAEKSYKVLFDSQASVDHAGYTYNKAKRLFLKQKNLEEKARQFKAKLQTIPRDVQIEIKEDEGSIECTEKDYKWNLKKNGQFTQEAVDFFVEYGFEKLESNSPVQTQIVKTPDKIPENMATLQNKEGVYLLPKPLPEYL